MRTLLLTGGSGFLGHWIARHVPAPFQLRLLARPTSDLSLLDAAGVAYERAPGDLLDPASLRVALAGVEAVIHAAGWIGFDRRDAARVRQANLDGSLNLFRAALEVGTPRVVHTASIFALGHAEQGLVTEGIRFNGAHLLDIPYVRAKRELEEASQALIDQGLPLVRLYPGLCLGPEDRTRSSSAIVGAWLRGRVPALVQGGICFVDVRDAAAAHLAALERGVVGERYLAPGYNLTHEAFFTALAKAAGRHPPRLMVPGWLGVAGAGVLERLMAYPPLRRDEARLMRHRWWYEDARSRVALGFSYRPFEETLRATLAEYGFGRSQQ